MPVRITPQAMRTGWLITDHDEDNFYEGALKLQQDDALPVDAICIREDECRYCRCRIGKSKMMAKSHVPHDDRASARSWAQYKCLICGYITLTSFASFDEHMQCYHS